MKTFKDIIAWQKGYQLALKIYKYTENFPSHERFGLRSQIREASVSVISNIAEGHKRKGAKDRLRFYNLSESSLEEVKCQSMLAFDLGYLRTDQYEAICELENETGRILNGWIRCQS